jgi:hypothetical protein
MVPFGRPTGFSALASVCWSNKQWPSRERRKRCKTPPPIKSGNSSIGNK